MTRPAARKTSGSFNASVHGARGLFAVMVFVFHVANSGLPTFIPPESFLDRYLLHSLKFGVELFFAISGFVIVGALARSPSARSFLWDRVTRIYPLLWMTLVVITLASLALGDWLPPVGDWVLNFLAPPPVYDLPQVNPAAWSLGYEVSFYALCAACWTLRRRGLPWRVLAVTAGAVGLVFFPRAMLMPAGVLIAARLLDRPAIVRAALAPGLWLLAFLVGWRTLELAAPGGDIAAWTPARAGVAAWCGAAPLLLLAGVAGGLALRGIVEGRGLLAHALRTAPLQWLGTVSYSFYLWHPVVMGGTKTLLYRSGAVEAAGPAAQALFALVSLPPALWVAHHSQRVVEVRLTRFLRRLGPREGDGRAPVTATEDHGDAAGRAPGPAAR